MHAAATVSRPPLGVYWEPVVFSAIAVVFLTSDLFFWEPGTPAVFIALSMLTTAGMGYAAGISVWRYIRAGVTVSASDQAVVLNGRAFAFGSIDSVAFREGGRSVFRARQSVPLVCRLFITAGGQTYKFHWWAFKDDPVKPIVQHLLQRMEHETQRRTLEGEGWSVDHADLFTPDGVTPLDALSAAGIYDYQVRLWRGDEIEAFVDVPEFSPNALVLLRVAKANEQVSPLSQPLGRHLFTRKTSRVLTIVMALGTGWLMFLLGFAAIDRWAPQFLEELDLAGGVLALVLLLQAFFSLCRRYRFYERGVVATSIGGRREILYADVHRLSWRERPMRLASGGYFGTRLDVRLYPAAGPPLRINLYRGRIYDPDIDQVHARLSARSR